jgi:2-methylcitrate dehydratase
LFPGVKRARVTITTTGGEVYTTQTDVAKGAPEDPLTDEELIAKFRANAEGVLSPMQQEQALAATWQFDDVAHVGDYMRLFVTGR